MNISAAAATEAPVDLADALHRCAKGEHEALRLILETEGGRLLGVAHRMLQRRNRCLNILRDGRRLESLSPEDLTAMQDARLSAAGTGLDRLGDRVALKDCLVGLEPQTRQAILLAYVGGFTHGEIAAIQSVPLGTCKSWIRRGLDLLRRCLS